jgi:hypothetical protein
MFPARRAAGEVTPWLGEPSEDWESVIDQS